MTIDRGQGHFLSGSDRPVFLKLEMYYRGLEGGGGGWSPNPVLDLKNGHVACHCR